MGEDAITGHYRRAGLEEEILAALRESGLAASVDTLAPVDEFHTGGRRMTASLVDRLDLHPGSRVLDVGCGIGGTARYIAATRGAEVTGIDLTPEYVAAARALTEKAGPAGLVRFDRGDGTDLPYPDGSFDAACAIHTGMNIERKDLLAAGLARVLRAGGRLAVFDIMRTGDGEVGHPTPGRPRRPPASWPTPGPTEGSWRRPGSRSCTNGTGARPCWTRCGGGRSGRRPAAHRPSGRTCSWGSAPRRSGPTSTTRYGGGSSRRSR
ncbi:class I SAM-dependent methyltransferase [Nocardiopsis composta]